MKIFITISIGILLLTNQIIAQQWWDIGSAGFSAGQVDYVSMAIDGSGIPYVVYTDYVNSHKATVMRYYASSWQVVGSVGFSPGGATQTTIAIDGSGTPYVAFSDFNTSGYKVTVMRYYASGWQVVGSAGFSAGQPLTLSIAIDGSGIPYVFYQDLGTAGKATVMRYYEGSWEVVGSAGFSAGAATDISGVIDESGTPYIAFSDATAGKATVMRYYEGNWQVVGSAGFSAAQASYCSIAIDGSGILYVAYMDAGYSLKATVMNYNTNAATSSWQPVGSPGFTLGNANWTSMALDASGTPYVAYKDVGNGGGASVMKYTGNGTTGWEYIGSNCFSAGTASKCKIAISPNVVPVVAYIDDENASKATVKKYSENQDDPLPVELTSFNASINGSSIMLNWHTATEINNYGFEIERTANKNTSWEKIGFVEGYGNSNSPKEYIFTDKPNSGSEFKYRLKQIDIDGNYEYSPVIEVNLEIPIDFSVKQNYPNPFNPSTTIEFSIPKQSKVTLKIFDVLGSEVATLVNKEQPQGNYEIEFDGSKLTSGIYFYRLQAGDFVETKKMILMK